MQIELFGSPHIYLDGALLDQIKLVRSKALLFYLVLENGSHSRSMLANLFWGEKSESVSRRNLRKAIQPLNKLLGSILTIEKDYVSTRGNADIWVDVHQFQGFDLEGALKQGNDKLASYFDLYKGDILSGFYVSNAPHFEDWQLSTQTQFRTKAVEDLQKAGQFFADRGEYSAAILYARKSLRIEAWREETHFNLMLWLSRSGQRSAALTQFLLCEDALQKELEAEPSKELNELYKAIKTNQIVAEQIAEQGGKALGPVKGQTTLNLPTYFTSFHGREEDILYIAKKMQDGKVRLLTITGQGGMGKTRLATETAKIMVGRRFEEIIYVNLKEVRPGASLAWAALEAIYPQVNREIPPIEQLAGHISTRMVGIVLDNFEHLIESALQITEILDAIPSLTILVTSRQPLQLDAEWVYPLGGLNSRDDLETERSDAVQLFIDRASKVDPRFVPDPYLRDINEICQLVDGMPLSIELAASWAITLTPIEIKAEIKNSLDILVSENQDSNSDHHSVRTLLDKSFDSFSKKEQMSFFVLSLFVSDFDKESAEQISGITIYEINKFIKYSLLKRSQQGRFEMHELVKQYASEKLSEDPGKYEDGIRQFYRYYAQRLWGIQDDWHSKHQLTAYQYIALEHTNVMAAWNLALSNQDFNAIEKMHESLFQYLDWSGGSKEGIKICIELINQISTEDKVKRALILQVLSWQVTFEINLHQFNELKVTIAKAETIGIELEQHPGKKESFEAWINHQKGTIYIYQSEFAKAKGRLLLAKDIYIKTNALNELAKVYSRLGNIEWVSGNFSRAIENYKIAESNIKESRNERALAIIYNGIATVSRYINDAEVGKKYHEKAINVAEKYHDESNMLIYYAPYSWTHWYFGEYEKGLEIARKGLNYTNEIHWIRGHNAIYCAMSDCLMHMGEYQSALNIHLNELTYSDIIVGAIIKKTRGELEMAIGNFQEAQKYMSMSEKDMHKEFPFIASYVLALQSIVHFKLGKVELSLEFLNEAAQSAGKIRVDFYAYFTILVASYIFAKMGDHKKAITYYGVAKQFPNLETSKWFQDVFTNEINELLRDLPEEAKPGEEIGLWELVADLKKSL